MSYSLHRYVLDPAERAASTFAQLFVVILLATGSAGVVQIVQWGKAADVAGFAAVVSLLTSAATLGLPVLAAGPDLVARVVKTGLQAFLAVLAADQLSPGIVTADWTAALAVAVPAMLFAALKGLAAMAAPWSAGASLTPPPPVPPVPASAGPPGPDPRLQEDGPLAWTGTTVGPLPPPLVDEPSRLAGDPGGGDLLPED